MVEKHSNHSNTIPVGLGIGLAISIGTTILGSAFSAWLIGAEKIGEGSFDYIALVLLLLSSILGALCAIRIIGKKKVVICLSVAVLYFLSLLAINALFLGGTYSGVGETALTVLAGALSVALLGLRDSKKTNKARKK